MYPNNNQFPKANIHTNLTKAGEFVTADGEVRQAGLDDDPEATNFTL